MCLPVLVVLDDDVCDDNDNVLDNDICDDDDNVLDDDGCDDDDNDDRAVDEESQTAIVLCNGLKYMTVSYIPS